MEVSRNSGRGSKLLLVTLVERERGRLGVWGIPSDGADCHEASDFFVEVKIHSQGVSSVGEKAIIISPVGHILPVWVGVLVGSDAVNRARRVVNVEGHTVLVAIAEVNSATLAALHSQIILAVLLNSHAVLCLGYLPVWWLDEHEGELLEWVLALGEPAAAIPLDLTVGEWLGLADACVCDEPAIRVVVAVVVTVLEALNAVVLVRWDFPLDDLGCAVGRVCAFVHWGID